jgi:hypothetical protein
MRISGSQCNANARSICLCTCPYPTFYLPPQCALSKKKTSTLPDIGEEGSVPWANGLATARSGIPSLFKSFTRIESPRRACVNILFADVPLDQCPPRRQWRVRESVQRQVYIAFVDETEVLHAPACNFRGHGRCYSAILRHLRRLPNQRISRDDPRHRTLPQSRICRIVGVVPR